MKPIARNHRFASSLIVALLFATVACSSTEGRGGTQVTNTQTSGEGREQPSAEPLQSEAGRADVAEQSGAASENAGPAAPDGGGGAAAPGSAAAPSPGGPKADEPRAPSTGTGGDPIAIGISYLDAAAVEAGWNSLGYSPGSRIGNARRQAELVIAYVNARGGLGGREVVPVFHEIDVAAILTPSGRQREAQRMCSTWTEDNDVFAMLVTGPTDPNMLACAAQTQTPLITAGDASIFTDEERFREIADYYYVTGSFIADRREQVYIDNLAAQGFFESGSKVGLLYYDRPDYKRAVERSLKPALASHGFELAAEVAYPDYIQSPWPNYVLQFQAAGVDRVLFAMSEGNKLIPLFFMRAAENQRYRPRYGLSSNDDLGVLPQNAPREQLHGALAVSWNPYFDLSANRETVEPVSSTNALCRQIFAEGGEPPAPTYGWDYCDGLFLLEAALDLSSEITVPGFAAGVAALQDSWSSAFTYGSRFARDRHDGVSVAHHAAYFEQCACFRHTSPAVPLR